MQARSSTRSLMRSVAALAALSSCVVVRGQTSRPSDSTFGATPAALVAAILPKVQLDAHAFPLEAIRITGGPLLRSQRADEAMLLKLEPDRLMHYVRKNAGLAPKADHYGGWESGGNGIIGHYLSALCNMYAATGDAELLRRINYIVDELDDCQRAGPDGGIYSVKSDIGWFRQLRKGDPIYPTIVNGWYVTHKLMAGLRDAYAFTRSEKSKLVFLKLCDWAVDVCATLNDEQFQHVLDSEHGAPQDPLADAYAITGDLKYLRLAERFTHRRVFDPLLRDDGNALNGTHANTQIPKFIGYERLYELTGNRDFNIASDHFWNEVVHRRSWVTGGNSQWERFFPTNTWTAELDQVCGPETCNTYNMLKLTRQLFELEPNARQMDFFERALFNSVLPSQDNDGAGFVYYTPMQPGHYRTLSNEFAGSGFWCCTGTGLESHGRLGDLIYAHGGNDAPDDLYVNLFVPSRLDWPARGLKLVQETSFPADGAMKLSITLAQPTKLVLKIRYPSWAAGTLALKVNGIDERVVGKAGEYLTITRTWHDGDVIEMNAPMAITLEALPGDASYVAILHGPIVLAAPLGTAPLSDADFRPTAAKGANLARQQTPADDVPVLIGGIASIVASIKPVEGKPLAFTTGASTKPAPATLIPFYEIGAQRYSIYLKCTDAAGYAKMRDDAQRRQAAADELERQTIDRVVVASQQSEADHKMEAADSSSGSASPPLPGWRDARGHFSYELDASKAHAGQTIALRCVYWSNDGGRNFALSIDGTKIATEHLKADAPSRYIDKTYPIPAALLKDKSVVRVRFDAEAGSVAGGVFDVRLVTTN